MMSQVMLLKNDSKPEDQPQVLDLLKVASRTSETTNTEDDSELQHSDSVLETPEDEASFFELFTEFDENEEEFYDFTTAMEIPDAVISF